MTVDESNWVIGFDKYHGDGPISFPAARAQGYEFCWLKSSEGPNFVDPSFRGDYNAASSAAFKVASYHFIRPYGDPAEQAHFWWNAAGQPRRLPGDLRDAIDLEVDGVTAMWLDIFEQTFATLSGADPVLYTAQTYFHQYAWLGNLLKDRCPLWIAADHPNPFIGSYPSYASRQWGTKIIGGSQTGLDFDTADLSQLVIPGDHRPPIYQPPTYPTIPPGKEYDMAYVVNDPKSRGYWVIDNSGAVFAYDERTNPSNQDTVNDGSGAPAIGGINGHPEYNAGPVVGARYWEYDGAEGLEFICPNGQGAFTAFKIARDGTPH